MSRPDIRQPLDTQSTGVTGVTTGYPQTPGGNRPDGIADNQVIPSVLRGDDGSAWYVRKVQSKVYMFGEHPGKKYATVYEGTLSGNTIAGQYWDCPKGQRTLKGNLSLQIEANGDTLKVKSKTGGIELVELKSYAIDNAQLPSAYRKPGFSSSSKNDLDGAWRQGTYTTT